MFNYKFWCNSECYVISNVYQIDTFLSYDMEFIFFDLTNLVVKHENEIHHIWKFTISLSIIQALKDICKKL